MNDFNEALGEYPLYFIEDPAWQRDAEEREDLAIHEGLEGEEEAGGDPNDFRDNEENR